MSYNPKIPDDQSRGGRRGSHSKPPGKGRHGKSVERSRGGGGGEHKKSCGSDFTELVKTAAALVYIRTRRLA